MSNYRTYWQNGLEKLKQRASQALSARDQDEQVRTVELSEAVFERLQLLAEEQRTTIEDVVHKVMEQHFFEESQESLRHISEEQIDRNPLLLLDGICRKQLNDWDGGRTN